MTTSPHSTRKRPQATWQERNAATVALRDQLEAFASSTNPAELAEFEARFDRYSPRNAHLIVMQMPEATVVHGFHEWRAHGRYVRKGEHGIKILAPMPPRDNPQAAPLEPGEITEQRIRFRVAYVFDISQTEPNEES